MADLNDIQSGAGSHGIRLADLPKQKPTRFSLVPAPEMREALKRELDLVGLHKLRFEGVLRAEGRADWRLNAKLGATVVQPCGLTLAPVTTRIDEPVLRHYAPAPDADEDQSADMEMPEDDTLEPLSEFIDLHAVMVEALALALPLYPRAKDSGGDSGYTAQPADADPLSDESVKPFAGLAALRDKLGGKS